MALTAAEFVAGLAHIGGIEKHADAAFAAQLARGVVRITFEALPDARLGGLLHLPRARVTLHFEGVPEASRVEFLRRFDLAFQRGGG